MKKPKHTVPHQFLGGIPEDPPHRRAAIDHGPVRRDQRHDVRAFLNQRAEPVFALLQRRLRMAQEVRVAPRVEHRVAIGGLDQTAGQRRKDRRTGVGLAQRVVVLKHGVGLGDHDVGDGDVLGLCGAQRRESFDGRLVVRRRQAGEHADEDGRINPVSGHGLSRCCATRPGQTAEAAGRSCA